MTDYLIKIRVPDRALLTNAHHRLAESPGVTVLGIERAPEDEQPQPDRKPCPGCEPIPDVGMVCPDRECPR